MALLAAARKTGAVRPRTLYTIGHSTRTTRDLVELLLAHGVAFLKVRAGRLLYPAPSGHRRRGAA